MTRARAQEFTRLQVFVQRFQLGAMRFNLSLLFGAMGVLAARTKDPDDSDELQEALVKLEMANLEITSLKLEVVRLKEELGACVQGHNVLRYCWHASPSPVLISMIFRCGMA